MTLPKNLQEKRDKLAEQSVSREFYELHEADARVRHFKYGFDVAFKLLIPQIENFEKTIDCAAKYLESRGYNDADLSEPEFQMLQSFYEALQSWQRFTEGGK